MNILQIILCIFIYFIILSFFRIITILIIIKCIVKIKDKTLENINKKMKGVNND